VLKCVPIRRGRLAAAETVTPQKPPAVRVAASTDEDVFMARSSVQSVPGGLTATMGASSDAPSPGQQSSGMPTPPPTKPPPRAVVEMSDDDDLVEEDIVDDEDDFF
jgi:hypothetical protein